MFQLAKRIIGRPLLRRSRRLAQAFLEQTRRADEVQRNLLLERVARHAEGSPRVQVVNGAFDVHIRNRRAAHRHSRR